MIKFIPAMFMLVLLIAFSVEEAFAAKVGMRCSRGLINVGDNIVKVLTSCGEPLVRSDSSDDKGNTYIRLGYLLNGATYKITAKNHTITVISRTR